MSRRNLSLVPDLPSRAYTPPNNLPAVLSGLVGREKEVTSACALIHEADVRLLTIVGPPGVGKTRLATEIGWQVLPHFDDGVYFVPLASLTDPGLLLSRVAQVLGIKETQPQPLLDTLKEYLHRQYCLLVLDNFEHLAALGAAPQLLDLLGGVPGLKCMVTSRTPLGVSGEHRFTLSPLSLPPRRKALTPDELNGYEAVELFARRAQSVLPDFKLTTENSPAVAEICRKLDGLPLAIELAAAKANILSPQALLPRITALHTTGIHDAMPHHQTLRDAIRWSYDLLDEESRQLFRTLASFKGGCTLEAIEATYAPESSAFEEPEIISGQLLDAIGTLVSQNLLGVEGAASAEPRYYMLETVWEYARQLLEKSPEASEILGRHLRFFALFAEQIEGDERIRRVTDRASLQAKLEAEYDNFQAALAWGSGKGNNLHMALRLAAAMTPLIMFLSAGYWAETGEWLEKLLHLTEQAGTTSERAKGLTALGILTRLKRNYAQTRPLFERSLVMYRELGDASGVAKVLDLLSREFSDTGDIARAEECQNEALAIYKRLDDRRGMADILLKLGINELLNKQNSQAARSLWEQSLAIYRELDDQMMVAASLNNFGVLALAAGDYKEARSFLEESVKLHRDLGDIYGVSMPLTGLGEATLHLDDLQTATHCLMEAFDIKSELGHKVNMSEILEFLAGVASGYGDDEKAARLLGASEALLVSAGAPLNRITQENFARQVEAVRLQLGETLFTQRVNEGKLLSLQQVKALLPPTPRPRSVSVVVPIHPVPVSGGAHDSGLTIREVEVLRLVAIGLSDAQVAERLFLSTRTVHNHLYAIYNKLGVGSRTAAVKFGVDSKII